MSWSWKMAFIVIVVLAYGLFGKIDGQYGEFIKPSWMKKKEKKIIKKKEKKPKEEEKH